MDDLAREGDEPEQPEDVYIQTADAQQYVELAPGLDPEPATETAAAEVAAEPEIPAVAFHWQQEFFPAWQPEDDVPGWLDALHSGRRLTIEVDTPEGDAALLELFAMAAAMADRSVNMHGATFQDVFDWA